jgi:hypothetical protein
MTYGLGWVAWYTGGYPLRRRGDALVKKYLQPYNLIQYALGSVAGGEPKYLAIKTKKGPRDAAGWNYSLVAVTTPPADLTTDPGPG